MGDLRWGDPTQMSAGSPWGTLERTPLPIRTRKRLAGDSNQGSLRRRIGVGLVPTRRDVQLDNDLLAAERAVV
jgi:hypothetical protein